MSSRLTYDEFDHFDEWDSFDQDNDIFPASELETDHEWEDDGAIAEVRESEPIISYIDQEDKIEGATLEAYSDQEGTSGQVFSLLEKSREKRSQGLLELVGPSEDELSRIEEIGIDDYIDIVLAEEEADELHTLDSPIDSVEEEASIVNDLIEEDTCDSATHIVVSELENISDMSRSIGEDADSDLVVHPHFCGVAVSLPTLFDEDSEVEYTTSARLAHRLTQENISTFFIATSDGEGETLSREERVSLAHKIRKSTGATSQTLLVMDISAPSIRQSKQLSDDVAEIVDAFVVTINSSTKDPFGMCETLHRAHHGHPIFIRLEGSANDLPISPEFLYDLPISGIIDATGDIEFLMHLITVYGGPVYVGTVSMITIGHHLGVAGVVLPHAALHASKIAEAFAGDITAQLELASWERETGNSSTRAIKLALENDSLVSSMMRE